MDEIFVYEIFLDEMLVVNSGNVKFKTEEEARKDAKNFISYAINKESEFKDNVEDDFDIIISEVTEEDFTRGW